MSAGCVDGLVCGVDGNDRGGGGGGGKPGLERPVEVDEGGGHVDQECGSGTIRCGFQRD